MEQDFIKSGGIMMEVVEKMKKEPRVIVAMISAICFYLPFFNVVVSADVMGESQVEVAQSVSGFQLLSISILCIFVYIGAIGQIILPFIKSKELIKKLYAFLPVVEIIFLIIAYILVRGKGSAQVDTGYGDMESKIVPTLGFWVVILCNIAIFLWTCISDFGIKNKEDIQRSISNINLNQLSNQASETIKEIGSAVQAVGNMECPNCHQKVRVGKKFCSHCGAALPEKAKPVSKESQKCISCGHIVAEEMKFCPECGTPVPKKEELKKTICSQCGVELQEGTKFCPECGTPYEKLWEKQEEKICSQCGKELMEGAKFCLECGHKVRSEN